MTDCARRGAAAALTALLMAVAAPAAAETGTDMVFRTGLLVPLETGRTVVYDRVSRREAVDGDAARVLLSLVDGADADGAAARVTLEDTEGRTRALGPFPAGEEAGNPVLLAFLEFTARGVSEATGGSPFYIRNRIRDAFREGGATETREAPVDGTAMQVTRIAYRPFDDDPNAAELGAFTDLVISFEVADAVPGGFVAMEATTGGAEAAWLERIAYAGAPPE